MARINIEKKLFTDNRFINLCIKLGSRRNALGALIEAWLTAQTWVSAENPDGLIPMDDWKTQELCDSIIEIKLARVENDHVYVVGAREQFSWLAQRSEAGKSTSEKKLAALANARAKRWPKPEEETSERNQNEIRTGSNGSEPLPLSLTLSQEELSTKYEDPLSSSDVVKLFTPPAARKSAAKNLSAEVHFENENALICAISDDQRERWGRLYPDGDFLSRCLLRAFGYYRNNPAKMPKTLRGWVRALSHWFETDWVKHVKTMKGSGNSKIEWVNFGTEGGNHDAGVLSATDREAGLGVR